MLLWGTIFILTLLAEIVSVQLVSIWFSIGALCAFLAAYLGFSFFSQMGIFVAVTVILLIITRGLVKRLRVNHYTPTNLDSQIGMVGTLTLGITPNTLGRAQVGGVSWRAKLCDSTLTANKGDRVRVVQIDGTTIIVEKLA